MSLTFLQAKNFLHRYAANGVSALDPRVAERINEASHRLFSLTNFVGKRVRYIFNASQATITLPHHLETVLGVSVNGSTQYQMRNEWFEYLEGGPGALNPASFNIHGMVDRGDGYPTFADLCGPGYLKVYADLPEAVSTSLIIQGIDENGNEVMTQDINGNWISGETIAINNATPAVSTNQFAEITAIIKPVTNGYVRIYQQTAAFVPGPPVLTDASGNATGSSQQVFAAAAPLPNGSPTRVYLLIENTGTAPLYVDFDTPATVSKGQKVLPYGGALVYGEGFTPFGAVNILGTAGQPFVAKQGVLTSVSSQVGVAIITPEEMVPNLRRYLIPGIPCDNGGRGASSRSARIVALCQRRWLPVSRDNDLVYPANLGALKHMLLSIEKEERNDFQNAQLHEAQAKKILTDELKQSIGPVSQTLNIQVQGFTSPHHQMM